MEDWWRVEVSDHDGQIVAIETDLSGREIGGYEGVTIRKAAYHLLAFIGDPEPKCIGGVSGCTGGPKCTSSHK